MKELLAKLLIVQAEMKPIERDSLNPHFKNRYFDINSLLAELKPVLTKYRLVLIQPIIGDALTTVLYDADSGDKIESSFTLPQLGDMQKLGGAISYARRYALVSMFALEGEDNDGEGLTATVKPQNAPGSVSSSITTKCAVCSKEFIPDQKFPFTKTCSAKCGIEAKTLKANGIGTPLTRL
jgi:hypothetical protein